MAAAQLFTFLGAIRREKVEAMREQTLKAIAKRPAAFPRVIATSSEKGQGLAELRAEIAAACEIGEI